MFGVVPSDFNLAKLSRMPVTGTVELGHRDCHWVDISGQELCVKSKRKAMAG